MTRLIYQKSLGFTRLFPSLRIEIVFVILYQVMKPIELSYYILQNYSDISPMKLQKLLYYTKVWSVVSGEQFFDAEFEKWEYGPVNKETYQEFKKYGDKPIPSTIAQPVSVLKSKEETLNVILDSYAPYDATTLSAMTHQDEPWKKAAPNSIISDKAISLYYSKQPFAKNFPFNANRPFYPVQSDLHYAYIFDMSKKDAEAASVFPSYIEYKKYIGNAHQNLSELLKNSLA